MDLIKIIGGKGLHQGIWYLSEHGSWKKQRRRGIVGTVGENMCRLRI